MIEDEVATTRRYSLRAARARSMAAEGQRKALRGLRPQGSGAPKALRLGGSPTATEGDAPDTVGWAESAGSDPPPWVFESSRLLISIRRQVEVCRRYGYASVYRIGSLHPHTAGPSGKQRMGPFVPARTNIAAASMSPTTANTSSNRFIAYPGISDLMKCGRGTA